MSKIHNVVSALVGLRKLFFTILTISIIALGLVVTTGLFIAAWYLGADVFTGDNLVSVYNTGFQYIAVVAGGYLAINVANKWVAKWINKRK